MNDTDVRPTLTMVFRRVFGDNTLEVSDQLSARDVAQWDSLTHMVLISSIEKEFGIKFKLKELNKMQNVGDMIALILEKRMSENT